MRRTFACHTDTPSPESVAASVVPTTMVVDGDVNGYAGVEPRRYGVIRDLTRRFPSRDSLDALRGAGVRYVVLHRDGLGPNKSARLERELPRYANELVEVVRFGPDSVLELRPAPGPERDDARGKR